MAEATNHSEKPKRSKNRSNNRSTRKPESNRGRPVPSDKILEYLQTAKKEIDTLSGIQQRETREKEKSRIRPETSGSFPIQKPGEVEKIQRGTYTVRKGHSKTNQIGVRPQGFKKAHIQSPGEIEKEALSLPERAVRIKETITQPELMRPNPSPSSLVQKPGEITKGVTIPAKRSARIKKLENIRPSASVKDLVRRPGELPKFQGAMSSFIHEPVVERIEPNHQGFKRENASSSKRLGWIALILGIFNLTLLLGIYSMKTFTPRFAFDQIEATQMELAKEMDDMKYKSSLRSLTDTLFKARVLIEVNKDYKEAAKELERVKMGLNSLETLLPDQRKIDVATVLTELESALNEVQKGPTPLQEKLSDISTRLNALH